MVQLRRFESKCLDIPFGSQCYFALHEWWLERDQVPLTPIETVIPIHHSCQDFVRLVVVVVLLLLLLLW